jgi:hypothetical protein
MNELTDDQLRRQEDVDQAIWIRLAELAEKPIEWDIELIGAVRDAIGREFEQRGIMSPMDFYPHYE